METGTGTAEEQTQADKDRKDQHVLRPALLRLSLIHIFIVLAAIPLLLLSAARKWKGAVLYILIFGGSLCLEMFGLSRLTGVANYIAVAVVGILLRFTPSVVMGYFVVTTTTVSEFVAAMERLHLPQQITIPMSVMFRFFPTVAEEWSAIGAVSYTHLDVYKRQIQYMWNGTNMLTHLGNKRFTPYGQTPALFIGKNQGEKRERIEGII